MGFKGRICFIRVSRRLQALLQHLLAFLPLASLSVELFLPPVPHSLSQAHWEVPPVWMTDSAWAVQGQPQSCLTWALSNVGQLPGSSPRSHPCSSLLQKLAHKPNTNMHSAEYQSRLWPVQISLVQSNLVQILPWIKFSSTKFQFHFVWLFFFFPGFW